MLVIDLIVNDYSVEYFFYLVIFNENFMYYI